MKMTKHDPPGRVLLIQRSFRGSPSEWEHEALRLADPIANIPGLTWMIWTINPDTQSVCGICLFATEQAVQRFVDGPVAAQMRASQPDDLLRMTVQEVLPGPSAITRAPIPGLVSACETT